MSSNPLRSLEFSVNGKSSCFHAGASSFQLRSAARVASGCSVFHHESHSTALHSSWISRLRRTAAADAVSHSLVTKLSGDLLPKKLTISTHEFRTPSFSHKPNSSFIKYRNLRFAAIKPPPPPIARGDVDGRVVASFGPFQMKEMRKSTGMVFEKGVFSREEEGKRSKFRALERKVEDEVVGGQNSPLVVQFRSRLTKGCRWPLEKGVAVADAVSSSGLNRSFGPWKVGSRLKMPVSGSLLASACFRLDAARRRGAAFVDLTDDGFVSRAIQDIHSLNDAVTPQQLQESEEPFSFWNMGRFKRDKFVSSVSPSFDLSSIFGRKRKINADDINAFKYRRI